MIWWPFNINQEISIEQLSVVTHQWSGDHSMYLAEDMGAEAKVVTHQWSGDHSIASQL